MAFPIPMVNTVTILLDFILLVSSMTHGSLMPASDDTNFEPDFDSVYLG